MNVVFGDSKNQLALQTIAYRGVLFLNGSLGLQRESRQNLQQ